MKEAIDIASQVVDGRYKNVLTNKKKVDKLMATFHKEVAKQVLMGNRVILPGNIETEIVKHSSSFWKTARIGFAYKLVFRMEKKHKYKVKFKISPNLYNKLNYIIKNTDIEYRAVMYGYK